MAGIGRCGCLLFLCGTAAAAGLNSALRAVRRGVCYATPFPFDWTFHINSVFIFHFYIYFFFIFIYLLLSFYSLLFSPFYPFLFMLFFPIRKFVDGIVNHPAE